MKLRPQPRFVPSLCGMLAGLLLAGFWAVGGLSAVTIHLKGGGKLEAKTVQVEGDSIRVQLEHGSMVLSAERLAPESYHLLGDAAPKTKQPEPEPQPEPQPEPASAAVDGGTDPIHGFLAANCFACHGPDEQKANLRLDTLSREFTDPRELETWGNVGFAVHEGEMPPSKHPQPAQADVAAFLQALEARLATARENLASQTGRTPLRRLTRTQYELTLEDLLNIPLDVKSMLPEDTNPHGFDTLSENLTISAEHIERYLKAGGVALERALSPPARNSQKLDLDLASDKKIRENVDKRDGYRFDGEEFVIHIGVNSFPGPTEAPVPGLHKLPEGLYEWRFTARAVNTSEVVMGVWLQGRGNPELLLGYFLATEEPQEFVFREYREGTNLHFGPVSLPDAWALKRLKEKDRKVKVADLPGLAVRGMTFEGPLDLKNDPGKPSAREIIFGDLDPANLERHDVPGVLQNFATKAFRRPVPTAEIRPYADLVEKLAEKQPRAQAIRVGLQALLASPEFLFIQEDPGSLNDFQVASRLSYFLWNSMPDAELFELAQAGRLRDPQVLSKQVERMLGDPKSLRFRNHFVNQWLDLDMINDTLPDDTLYPEFDALLQHSMVEETRNFFNEILNKNLSVTNFLHSEFGIINEPLAELYGVEGVEGFSFQKVQFKPEHHRGGVVTHASVLKVTANGTSTSPVLRGVWFLRNILGSEPPPPPEGVPAVEPDIRGTTTIREQLAKHSNDPSCASCHKRIDPPGFALENYDVIGGWRERYRTPEKDGVGDVVKVEVEGRTRGYRLGPDVEAGSRLASGQSFDDLDGLKRLLLNDRETVVSGVMSQLVAYSTGAPVGHADRQELNKVIAQIQPHDYGLRSGIHALVQSPLFLNK